MSRFTVLGATGFIGSALVRHLRDGGHEVFAPERDDTSILRQDLGHVLYCIGLTADFRSRPFDTVRAHVTVLGDILAAARFESLVYLSSTRVYGRGSTGRESTDLSVNATDPSDLYNISKLMGESLCLHGGRRGVRVARLSNVIGPDHGSANFLFDLIREAKQGRVLLRSDPASAKDYVLLDDVLPLVVRIAVSGQHSLYNVASGHALSNSVVCAELARLTGCTIEVLPNAPLLRFPDIETQRIREEFGFRPRDVLEALPMLVSSL